MRHILTVLFTVFSMFTTANAAQTVSCIPTKVTFQSKNINLPGPEKSGVSQVYFFKNTGKQGIWIDHPTNRSMNAGWSSYVRAGNWSAFLLNRQDFAISCAVIQPGKVDYLDCAKAISVCRPKEAIFKIAPKGTYWLAEDKPWDEIIKAVEKRGVSLK